MTKSIGNIPAIVYADIIFPGTLRTLNVLEIEALLIYWQVVDEIEAKNRQVENGKGRRLNLPRPKNFEGIFKRRISKILKEKGALDDLSPGEEKKQFIQNLTDSLFADYMYDSNGDDLRHQLKLTDIIRRVSGVKEIYYLDSDLTTALKSLDVKLMQENAEYKSGTMTYAQVDQANIENWVVPELGIFMPTPSTIRDRLATYQSENGKGKIWEDVLEKVFGTDASFMRKKYEGITLQDIESDYLIMTDKLRRERNNPDYLPETNDIIERYRNSENVLGFHDYIKVLKENKMTLDDLRESLGFQRLKRPTSTLPKVVNFNWLENGDLSDPIAIEKAKKKIIKAHVRLWAQKAGIELETMQDEIKVITSYPPPTASESIRANSELAIRSREDPGLASIDNAISSLYVMNTYFGGANQLLAAIEKEYGVNVYLPEGDQLSQLVRFAKEFELTPDQMPAQVRHVLGFPENLPSL